MDKYRDDEGKSYLHYELYGRGLKSSKNPIIGKNVRAEGQMSLFDCQDQITLEDDVFLGHRVTILTGYHDYTKRGEERQATVRSKPVTIKKGAWVASLAIILPGVTIGENSVVGAGSVVTKDIPPNQLWAGNPARFIKEI